MLVLMVRTALVYLAVIASMRIMGKRQIGEMQPAELVVTIIISEIAAVPLTEEGTPLFRALLPIFVIVGFEIFSSALSMLHPSINKLIDGGPSFIIVGGKIQLKEMKKQRITLEDIYESMRVSGYTSLEQISCAVLETNGRLSFIPKPACQPATAGDLKLANPDPGVPVILIADGAVCKAGLKFYGHDEEWLEKALKKLKTAKDEVFLLTVDAAGGFYCVKRSELA